MLISSTHVIYYIWYMPTSDYSSDSLKKSHTSNVYQKKIVGILCAMIAACDSPPAQIPSSHDPEWDHNHHPSDLSLKMRIKPGISACLQNTVDFIMATRMS